MEEETQTKRKKKISCVKYFDALWFCYSPVHQLKRYYVHGDIDDCIGHWSTLMSCLKQKTRFQDDSVASLETACLWELRTAEEAAQFWKNEFVDTGDGSKRPTV